MKFAIIFIFSIIGLGANFLGSIYVELQELDLSKEQQRQIKSIIREHHVFLRQWYINSKKNNDRIMESFSSSSLSRNSNEVISSLNLANARFQAEQDFLISVYEILNNKQRAKFGKQIRENENTRKIPRDKPRDSQHLDKPVLDSNLFGDKNFKR